MFDKLNNLRNNSYAPYSNFKVSAILITKDDIEFNGVNVENASYWATICAERSAFVSAISAGYKKCDFKELHILTSSNKICTCCIICRQVITEFCDKDMPVYCYSIAGDVKKFTVSELCPYPFDEGDLKWKVDL